VHLTLGLRQRNQARLAQVLAAGRALTPAEYEQYFAPEAARVTAAVRELQSLGMRAEWSSGSSVITAEASAGEVSTVFAVTLYDFRARDGTSYFAPDRAPLLPAVLGGIVEGVGGLDSSTRLHTRTIPASGLLPDDVLHVYNIAPLRAAGLDGGGETIVLPEIEDLPNHADLDAYAAEHHLPAFDVTVKRNRSWGTPDHPGRPGGEVTLDLEIAHAIAPRARLIVYTGSSRLDQGTRLMDQMVRDNPGAIISDSLGACETDISPALRSANQVILDRAAAQGMSHFAASGDSGAYDCGQDGPPGVDFPAASASVTAVGGTTLFEGSGQRYVKEAAWGNPIGQSGAGGGLSSFVPQPQWQKGPGVSNRYSNGHRQVPDVAAVGDVNTGYSILLGGREHLIGGTSAASPLWAALAALIDQGLRRKGLPPIGFANPGLYWMGANAGHLATAPFHDVVEGNNLLYDATPGWDYGTGWGSMDAVALEAGWEAYLRQVPR
jgi:kumamolisin